ncbi:histidine kinase [Salmonella enterica subsp. enterica serovar Enteritidis]|nr:histidine kinase [Salmonella enterica subsp. enterica serovar Enteritidis]
MTPGNKDPFGTLFFFFLPKVKKNDDRTINPIDR